MKVEQITLPKRRVRTLALQTSAMVVTFLVASPAFAQSSPAPTVANAIAICTSTDTDGLAVAPANTRIVIASSAIVRPGNAAAAITSRASIVSFQIDGLVDGGTGKPGLFVPTGTPTTVPCDPYAGASVGYCFPSSIQTSYLSASAMVSVATGSTVTGAQGILIRRDAKPAGCGIRRLVTKCLPSFTNNR